ncbi:sulfite exporter TauE/SafE family protein [Streptomyces sp. NBC_00199]|uniref:sulfite exporter TauE/SafE family protein n=1 Tax=Streptomyces sp. NBC_00199 TaxID=2975678 RepID=UPI00225529C0|nr:sulfite exporter TauE/SafE family protein [Streptomyces sp. NBC_00199]MCX5265620.1 sulfite exporter TauE/SafE family protein [Streptomyces sp. NBC_00199]
MLTSYLILLLFGCLTGMTTVLFGFGGGFVTVPVVYGFWSVTAHSGADAMHVAVATSTAVMVVNSVLATLAQWRQGRIRREYIWPMAAFILVGAVAGSLAATRIGDSALRVLFAAYLLVTIADSLLRKGFLSVPRTRKPRPLSRLAKTLGGIAIGSVAACLGVGGSVMTVPLLRRRGLPMAEATAMANPLSAPVAVVGTIVYALAAPALHAQGGRLGSIELPACAALLGGSLPTIALVRRAVARVPDRVHSVAYVTLLVTVLIVMLVMGA